MASAIRFKRTLVKVGGSFRVVIPPEVVEAVKLKAGDSIWVTVTDGHILITPAKTTGAAK
jgi:AbrB family looped-hinge helix DNA binding protein